jgi:hypothetical protein
MHILQQFPTGRLSALIEDRRMGQRSSGENGETRRVVAFGYIGAAREIFSDSKQIAPALHFSR